MFAYCGSNPVSRIDTCGGLWDYVLDWGFIVLGIHDVAEDPSLKNWGCLITDIALAVVPFVPSGAGQIIKAADKAKDGYQAVKKATVIGETMDRVKDFAEAVGASDNLYDGFRLYKDWASNGRFGKIAAEIGGKISNGLWLYEKLRLGYTIFDIGIDASRSIRSSSYGLEQVISVIWESRNIIKAFFHFS